MDDDSPNPERLERITFSAKNVSKDVRKEADLRARQLMSSDAKLSYGDALMRTYAADEDLHRECLKTPPRNLINR